MKDEWKKVRILTWAEADRAAIDDTVRSRANSFSLTLVFLSLFFFPFYQIFCLTFVRLVFRKGKDKYIPLYAVQKLKYIYIYIIYTKEHIMILFTDPIFIKYHIYE